MSVSFVGMLVRARLLVVVALLVGCGTAVASAAGETGPTSKFQEPRFDPDAPSIREMQERLRRESERRALQRATPQAQRERTASRTRYQGLDDSAAGQLARETYTGELTSPVWNAREMVPGSEVVDWLNDFGAVVRNPAGKRSYVQSTVPVRVRDAQNRFQPTDLRLRDGGETFAPATPVVRSEIPKSSERGIALPDVGVSQRLEAPQAVKGRAINDRVVYANVLRDSDLWAQPIPSGIETFLQLRSEDSPGRFVLRFDLPRDARLRPAGAAGVDAVEVVQGDRRLALVPPPTTYDADGERVPSQYKIEGVGDDKLAVVVPHRGRDVRYPLLVDPQVIVNTGTGTTNGLARWGISDYAAPFGHNFGSDLHTYTIDKQQYYAGAHGGWAWQAPPNSYISQVNWQQVRHDSRNTTIAAGIFRADGQGWEPGQGNPWASTSTFSNYYPPFTIATAGQDQNYAHWFLQTDISGNTFCGFGCAFASVQSATIVLGDRHAPRISSLPRPSEAWTNDSAQPDHRITIGAQDPGLGIASMSLAGTQAASATGSLTGINGNARTSCNTNDLNGAPCATDAAATWTYRLAEGINTVSVAATDLPGNPSPTAQWTERIDRTGPTGQLIGTPASTGGAVTIAGTMNDPASGPGRWQLQVRRAGSELEWQDLCEPQTVAVAGKYQCRWTTTGGAYADGDYELRARMSDAVAADRGGPNAAATTTVPITVDNTAPQLSSSGSLREKAGQALVNGSWDLSASATDGGSGLGTLRTVVDGKPLTIDGKDTIDGRAVGAVSQPCPARRCSLELRDVPFDTAEHAPGNHTVEVQATDVAGNVAVDRFDVTISGRDQVCVEPSYDIYHIGPIFAGAAMSHASRYCLTAAPADEIGGQHDVTYGYGTCAPLDDEISCRPPLQIQSSPLCEKHEALYASGPAPPDSRSMTVKGVPAVYYPETDTLEVYTGRTTITIYGEDETQVMQAAEQLTFATFGDVPGADRPLDTLNGPFLPSPATLPPPDPTTLSRTTPCEL